MTSAAKLTLDRKAGHGSYSRAMEFKRRMRNWSGVGAMLGGLFLLVLVSRWLLISAYCSEVPFLDEWNDTLNLLRGLAVGQVDWAWFTANHNGHILLTERALTALCFWGNDLQWDAQMQCTFNALVAALIPTLLLAALGIDTDRVKTGALPALDSFALAAAALLFLTPALWYNVTWAFQSQFYFLILFSLAGLFLVLRSKALSLPWCAGGLCLLLAVGSMGSGFLAAVAIICVVGLGALRNRRFAWKEDGLTLLLAVAITGLGLVLADSHGAEKIIGPQNLTELVIAVLRNLAWPWTFESALAKSSYIGLVLALPAPILVVAWLLRARWLGLEPGTWETRIRLLVGLTLWSGGQLLVLSKMRGVYGRGGSWRHFDLHALWVFANVVALIILARALLSCLSARADSRGWKALLVAGLAGYAGLLAGGIVTQCVVARDLLDNRRARIEAEVIQLHAYLATGEKKLLTERPYDTPFPNIADPGALLDDPVVRGLLPAVVRPGLPMKPLHNVQSARAYIRAPMPPGIFTPPGVNFWVSWRPNLPETLTPRTENPVPLGVGEWELPSTRFRYLEVEYQGDLSGPRPPIMALFAQPPNSAPATVANLDPSQGGTWQSAVLKAPSPQNRLRIQETSPRAWMAIAEPVELGRLSFWCLRAREQYALLASVGITLMVLGYFLSTGPPLPDETVKDPAPPK